MGNSSVKYCKKCNDGISDRKAAKRGTCDTCYDKQNYKDVILMCKCGEKISGFEGQYVSKQDREKLRCEICIDKAQHGKCKNLVCHMCSNWIHNDKGYLEKQFRQYIHCDRCADLVCTKFKEGEYRKVTVDNHAYFFPVDMLPTFKELVLKRGKAAIEWD